MRTEALLLLADGSLYKGTRIGAAGTVGGELCFNTGMTGYQEVYSDPSYYGQILISTAAHIGNYGTVSAENESTGPQLRGIVIQNYATFQSRAAAEQSLDAYLSQHPCIGIADVDTRALVRHLTHTGAQNALISTVKKPVNVLKALLDKVPAMEGLDLAEKVSTAKAYVFGPTRPQARIAVLDFGIKRAILKHFESRNIGGMVFPARSTWAEIAKYEADGYFLSNGPGDPAAMDYVLPLIRELLATQKPLFGICLGHQLLARAYGLRTYKLPFGHRGLNHPILDQETKKAFVSTQNHGFAVDKKSVNRCKDVQITHTHLNDGTVAGIRVKDKPAFSVQFHPEAAPGPQETSYLFDRFAHMLYHKEKKKARVSH